MQFHALPDDMLVLILDLLIPPNMVHVEWKDQLFMLSVCQRLRRLALPLLYRYGFACIGFEPQSKTVLTNIDLISAAKETITMMDITIRNEPTGSMAAIINVLEKFPSLCANVISLKINAIAFDFSNQPMKQNKHKTERLTKLFPAVNDLTVGGNTGIYYKTLIQHYASGLRRLNYLQNDSILEQMQFEQLGDLDVAVYPSKRHLVPRINIHTIRRITIYILQPDCTWGLFGATGPGIVEVPNLCELKLGYVGKQDDYNFVVSMKDSCKLIFPQLKSLQLSGNAGYFPVVNSAVLPKKMDRIEISAEPATYLTFKNVVLPQANWQQYKVTGTDNMEASVFFPVFNSAIQHSLCRKGTTIYLGNNIKSFTAKSLACPSLTRLQISIPVDVDVVVKVIQQFPRLVWLALVIDSDRNRFLDTSSNSEQPVVSLNASLEDLSLDCLSEYSTQLQALKYLMPRLPALKKVGSWGLNIEHLKEFVVGHLSMYPHLANIRFI